ncbi:MAG: hypothetical protein SGPRY_002186 [Prymnesium sp.]
MAAAIKRASKTRSPLLNDLLKEGEASGDISMVELHVDKTVNQLMAESADTFFMTAGSRLTQAWSKAKATLTPGQACRYLVHYLDEYTCRGLPRIVDLELIRAAERRPLGVPTHKALGDGPVHQLPTGGSQSAFFGQLVLIQLRGTLVAF